jgi:hypothetical protein
MSTLVFDTLETELNQEIVIGNQLGLNSPQIMPWLYFLNNPAGTFKLGIYSGVTLISEKSFNLSDLKTQLNATGNSGHLFFHLEFTGIRLPFGFYTLKLSSTGYTYSSTSFLAWCKEWESKFDANPKYGVDDFTGNPLAVRIISLTPREI